MTPQEQAKLVYFCLTYIDNQRFKNIDWATIYDAIEEYHKKVVVGGVNLQKGGTP